MPGNSTEMQAGGCCMLVRVSVSFHRSSRCTKNHKSKYANTHILNRAHREIPLPTSGKSRHRKVELEGKSLHTEGHLVSKLPLDIIPSSTNTTPEETYGPANLKNTNKTRREKTPAFQDGQWRAECLAARGGTATSPATAPGL